MRVSFGSYVLKPAEVQVVLASAQTYREQVQSVKDRFSDCINAYMGRGLFETDPESHKVIEGVVNTFYEDKAKVSDILCLFDYVEGEAHAHPGAKIKVPRKTCSRQVVCGCMDPEYVSCMLQLFNERLATAESIIK